VVHVTSSATTRPCPSTFTYTKQPVNVAKLQQQGVEIAPQAGAQPSGVHFGFQIRPVIADDMAPLALTKGTRTRRSQR